MNSAFPYPHRVPSMRPDRKLQETLLQLFNDQYPEDVVVYIDEMEADERTVDYQMSYLIEHELIAAKKGHPPLMLSRHRSPNYPEFRPYYDGRITKTGIDFLENDGGLSAILGTVTVRLHADTIRDLIESRIAGSDAPSAEKARMIDKVKAMPEEGLKHLTTKLIDYGLAQGPNAWQALSGWLS